MTPAGLEPSRAPAANRLSPELARAGQRWIARRKGRGYSRVQGRGQKRASRGTVSGSGKCQQPMLIQHHNCQQSKQPRGRARWRRCWSSIAALAVICAHLGLVLHGAGHETLASDTSCVLCVAANQLCSAAAHPTLAVSPTPEASPPERDSVSCPGVAVPTGLARGPPLLA